MRINWKKWLNPADKLENRQRMHKGGGDSRRVHEGSRREPGDRAGLPVRTTAGRSFRSETKMEGRRSRGKIKDTSCIGGGTRRQPYGLG